MVITLIFLTNPKYRGSHKLDQLTELQGVVLSLQRANCRKAAQKECQGLSRKPNIADYRLFAHGYIYKPIFQSFLIDNLNFVWFIVRSDLCCFLGFCLVV